MTLDQALTLEKEEENRQSSEPYGGNDGRSHVHTLQNRRPEPFSFRLRLRGSSAKGRRPLRVTLGNEPAVRLTARSANVGERPLGLVPVYPSVAGLQSEQ